MSVSTAFGYCAPALVENFRALSDQGYIVEIATEFLATSYRLSIKNALGDGTVLAPPARAALER